LIEEIASLRRKTPRVVTENYKKGYKEGVDGDEAALKRLEKAVAGGRETEMGIWRLERQEVMEGNWNKGVKGLESLMKTMPETVARKERAERAEAYVVKGDRR